MKRAFEAEGQKKAAAEAQQVRRQASEKSDAIINDVKDKKDYFAMRLKMIQKGIDYYTSILNYADTENEKMEYKKRLDQYYNMYKEQKV